MLLRNIVSALTVLTAVTLGIRLGLAMTFAPLTNDKKAASCTLGDLLEQVVELVIAAHIVSHLVKGINALRFEPCREKYAVRAVVYYTVTCFLAFPIGLLVVHFFQPGVLGMNETEDDAPLPFVDALKDLLRNMVPNDLILATFQQYKTLNLKFALETDDHDMETRGLREVGEHVEGINILGLIIWFCVIGIYLRRLGDEPRFVVDLFANICKLMSVTLEWITGFLPLGLMIMSTKYVYEVGLHWQTLHELKALIAAVVCGLILYGGVMLPLMYFMIVKRNPFYFIKGIYPALLRSVWPTGGSLTEKMKYCCEEVSGVDNRITSTMLPIWGFVNTGGTAIYQTIAAVFISGISHVNLQWNQLLALSVLIAASSSETRSSGTKNPDTISVFIMFVLHVLEIPANNIWPLMTVNWALAWLTSPVDVLGFCFGSGIIEALSKKDLEEQQEMP